MKETIALLKSLGDEKVRARNTRNGAGDNQFGVAMVSKGCTSPFAPIWINEMVRRQG